VDKWIPVEEGLPPEGEGDVLASDGDRVDICYYTPWNRKWHSTDSDGECAVNRDRITHWMPLPEPPARLLAEGKE